MGGTLLTHEEFCNKVYKIYGDKYSVVSQYNGSKKEIKIKHNLCGTIFSVPAYKMTYTKGNIQCPCEYGKRFDENVNSIYATDKEFCKLFYNQDDTHKYTIHSGHKTDFVCPFCKNIVYNKRISDVYRRGLVCNHCSDHIPMGERIIYSLLDMKKDILDDCYFQFDKTFDWSNRKEYDFYFCINGVKYIVETNGEQHYYQRKNSKICSDLKYQQDNDEYKMNLAIKNGISKCNYIIIDCRKSDFNFIKENILNSDLYTILDLKNFDWDKCFKNSSTSLLIKVCDLWNSNVRDIPLLKKYTGLSRSCIHTFLCRGRDIGLCDYYSMAQTKVRCTNDDIVFDSIVQAGKYYNINTPGNISAVCRKKRKYCGIHPITNEPLMWEYV